MCKDSHLARRGFTLIDTISSWNSLGITRVSPTASPNCTIPIGIMPGVYQAVCTCNGGDVISSVAY